MATVKLYLDKRHQKQDGSFPLKIAVNHRQKTAYISTGVYLQKSQWDAKLGKVVNHPEKKMLSHLLDMKLSGIAIQLMELRDAGTLAGKSITQIKNLLQEKAEPQENNKSLFADYFAKFSKSHRNSRTREIYDGTFKMMHRFDKSIKELSFEDIDKRWLRDFENWLLMRGNSANTIYFHLKNIRAIFNFAIDEEATTAYPFRKMKIKREATPKRNLPLMQLAKIFNIENLGKTQKYVDFFKLQFLLIGINTVDLIKNAKYVDGRIEYYRAKTHRFYSIKACSEAMGIIGKYRGVNALVSFAENSKDYRSFSKYINAVLKKFNPHLSTYWARHSWATIASNLDVPKDTIAAALGHGRSTVTDIYIDFDMAKVDEANVRVINALNICRFCLFICDFLTALNKIDGVPSLLP